MPKSTKLFVLATLAACAIGCAVGGPKPIDPPGLEARWVADGFYIPSAAAGKVLDIDDPNDRKAAFARAAARIGPVWMVDPDTFAFLLKHTAAARRMQTGEQR